MPVINSIAARKDELTEWRRDIHAHPELGFQETRTAGLVAERLESWGVEVHRGIAKTGVVGVLHGRTGAGGKTIGLRADMDALPMDEANDVPWKSKTAGAFHGCGHDGHTTMLLAAARYLAETRNFEGTVHFIFQPAEEGRGGGRLMVEEGLFDRFPCDEVYALHNWPELPAGQAGVISGPMMAATDQVRIAVSGTGGHAAFPQKCIDPVLIAAQIVVAAQSLVARNADPLDPAVLSLTQIHGGSAFNVIPDQVTLGGTIRTFSPEMRSQMGRRLRDIAEGVAQALGGKADVRVLSGYPPTVNHPGPTERLAAAAEDVLGPGAVVRDMKPCMGAEDFSYMLEKRPGSYLWLGQAGGRSDAMVHNPAYDFNDEILPLGASLLARLAERELGGR